MPYNGASAGSFSTYMTYSPAWNGDNVRRPGHAFGALGRENEPVKGRCVHSGHLDFVRGRQSTVVIQMSELLEDRRYRSEMRLRS